MDEGKLITRVRARAGFRGREETVRAIRATLVAIGERLRDDERAAFARVLPPRIALVLDRCAYVGDFDRDELFARVARHEAVARGFANEHAEVVCSVLAELLPEGSLAHLRRQLGASIAALFESGEAVPELPRTTSTAGSTLATAREGSRHPVSESRPENAHRDSVARSDDPHARAKLSGACGYSQEQSGETLASGHRGARRPIADAKG